MPAKKTPTPVAATPVVNVDEFAGYPSVAILERRLEHLDEQGTDPIYLKDDPRPSCEELSHHWAAKGKPICPVCKTPFRKWKVRTINAAVPHRLHNAQYRLAYVKVMRDELVDAEQIPDLAATTDQTARRGEGGSLVLMKIPFVGYSKVKKRQLEDRERQDRSAKAVKSTLAESIGAAMGDEAGETVYGKKFVAEFDRPQSNVRDELIEK